jgi:hypothetical protein
MGKSVKAGARKIKAAESRTLIFQCAALQPVENLIIALRANLLWAISLMFPDPKELISCRVASGCI